MAGYLKAVWPDFSGCVFEVWPAPGARESLKKVGGFAPHIFEGHPGPPWPARLQKCTPQKYDQTAFRYPGVVPKGVER